MRINVYSQELTAEAHLIAKEARTGPCVSRRAVDASLVPATIEAGWCPVCWGKNGEHQAGCQDGAQIL